MLTRRQIVIALSSLGMLSGCGILPNLGKSAMPRMARLGILAADMKSATETPEIAGLKQGLGELGYVNGENITFELRDADGNFARLPELANELIQLPVDLIACTGSTEIFYARLATRDIPVVFVAVIDPVGRGIVASLDHPGGNITGVANLPITVFGKDIEFLTQLTPGLSRVAFFTDLDPAIGPGGFLGPSGVQFITTAANALGVQLKFLDVRSPEDVEPALAEALAGQAQAMISFGGPVQADATPRLVDFQLQNRIPVVSVTKEFAQAGGLLTYSQSLNAQGRAAATLVDKILKGARAADLPVEQPTVYELVINQTTAQALGLTIPPEVAQQVTQWVQ